MSADATWPASALIIEIPQADAVIGPWRRALDELAPNGVPAHVTCLFPVPHHDVIRGQATITAALRGFGAFDYAFTRCAWFGDEVLWLAPEDPEPFVALTDTLTTAFPHLQPYEGRFDTVVPHLTVGHKCSPQALAAAERDIAPNLPVHGRADRVSLYSPVGTAWQRVDTFAL